MKNVALSLLAVGVFAAGGLKAQSLDEIVSKHNEAVGGEKAWKNVSSIVYTGSMVTPNGEFSLIKSVLANKGMRVDIDIMGQKNFTIVTPNKGWSFWPIGGQSKPEEIPADDLAKVQTELEVMDELMTYKASGAKLELSGKEKIDGKDLFKLAYTDKNQNEKTLFVDPATYYVVRQVEKGGPQGDAVVTMSDYKKLPEGITVAMSVESPQGPVKMSKVEVNTIKDESIFKP